MEKELDKKLKERFVKDMGLPIRLFKEPYFSERLELLDSQFGCKEKYEKFKILCSKYENPQDYFKEYNKLKEAMINYLSENEKMKEFKTCDFSKFQIKNRQLPSKDIYKMTNLRETFLSIDMKKANFSAVKHYDKSIVGNKETYDEFISMFTDEEHFKSSKYIRQVVFGNQNPKRQVTYERYLMDKVLSEVLEIVDEQKIAYFNADEIVLYSDNINKQKVLEIVEKYNKEFPLSIEEFTLQVIQDVKTKRVFGYLKRFDKDNFELKSVNADMYALILRQVKEEPVTDGDLIFEHNVDVKVYAKLLEVIEIDVI